MAKQSSGLTQRKSWDLRQLSDRLPSPTGANTRDTTTKGAADAATAVDAAAADGDADYVEGLENRLFILESQRGCLERERAQLAAQLADSAGYIEDLEKELLRLQEQAADDEALCRELAEENDQLRSTGQGAVREAAVQTADPPGRSGIGHVDEASQTIDVRATELAARVAELTADRQSLCGRIDQLTGQLCQQADVAASLASYRQLKSECSEQLQALEQLRSEHSTAVQEAGQIRAQFEDLAESVAQQRSRWQLSLAETASEQDRHRLESSGRQEQLLKRLASKEAQLIACKELLQRRWHKSDSEWQAVKTALSQQSNDGQQSRDQLLRHLANCESRLLLLLQPSTLPLANRRGGDGESDGNGDGAGNSGGGGGHWTGTRRLQQLLGRRPSHRQRGALPQTANSDDVAADDRERLRRLETEMGQQASEAAARVASTLALMERRIQETEAAERLVEALKLDCDNWKRRCRKLEEALVAAGTEADQSPQAASSNAEQRQALQECTSNNKQLPQSALLRCGPTAAAASAANCLSQPAQFVSTRWRGEAKLQSAAAAAAALGGRWSASLEGVGQQQQQQQRRAASSSDGAASGAPLSSSGCRSSAGIDRCSLGTTTLLRPLVGDPPRRPRNARGRSDQAID